MGAIHLSTTEFFDELSEVLGYKCGLVLDESDLRRLLADDEMYAEYAELKENEGLRIRSEVFAAIFEYLLYRLGRLDEINADPMGEMFRRYRKVKKKREQAFAISEKFNAWVEEEIERVKRENERSINPTPFIIRMGKQYGASGLKMAMAAVESFSLLLFKSPWGVPTHYYENMIELKALFESEGLDPLYGKFIDQRYIDYIHRNFDSIDKMNWRKFEGLTGEFFDRAGYHVELGTGRNDDGVDVRVWPTGKGVSDPPALIIQCKRQKASVEKVVVKSLYADVLSEKARSGLIVTTARLSPGARKVCVARGYPIGEADRPTLKEWVLNLRRPGHGSFV